MSDIVQTPDFNPKTTALKASFFLPPSELRNTIYELLLLRLQPIAIDPTYSWDLGPLGLTTGLLRVCDAIHHEATSLFYSRNQFDFSKTDPKNVPLFFERIGSRNAGCVRDILIKFPEFHSLEPGNVTFDEESINMLMSIQSSCTNLSTLTTCVQSTGAMEDRLNNLDNFNTATEALELVNARFNAIPSLREIVLRVDQDGTGYQLRQRMKEYGWQLNPSLRIGDGVCDVLARKYNYIGCDYNHDPGLQGEEL